MAGESENRGDKRSRIIEAAVEVFAAKGFHQSRVTDIATLANVADGTIYLYFKSKEDLLLSVFEEKMGHLITEASAALEDIQDPLERLRELAHYHFRQVRDHRAVAEVLSVELRLSNKFLREYRPTKLWEYLDLFGSAMREGQRLGLIREDIDTFVVMWAFFGAMDELGMQWVLLNRADKSRFELEAAADQVAEVFIRGLAVNR